MASLSSATSRSRRCSSFSNLPNVVEIWQKKAQLQGLKLDLDVNLGNLGWDWPLPQSFMWCFTMAKSNPSCGTRSICLSLVILNIQSCQIKVTRNKPTISNHSQKGISDDMFNPTQEDSLTNTMWLRVSTLYEQWMHLSCSALLLLSVSCLKAKVSDFQLESRACLTMFRRVPVFLCAS